VAGIIAWGDLREARGDPVGRKRIVAVERDGRSTPGFLRQSRKKCAMNFPKKK
jgi:hypothetical protein